MVRGRCKTFRCLEICNRVRFSRCACSPLFSVWRPRAAHSMTLHAGDITWVVGMRGFPSWPARLCNEAEADQEVRLAKRGGSQLLLHTFGDQKYMWCSPSAVLPFAAGQLPRKPSEMLAKAVREAITAAQALGVQVPRASEAPRPKSTTTLRSLRNCRTSAVSVTSYVLSTRVRMA